jgi:hypothetical protein
MGGREAHLLVVPATRVKADDKGGRFDAGKEGLDVVGQVARA